MEWRKCSFLSTAKIHLDKGLVVSDVYAHKCCNITGIKSKSKHYQYKKPGEPGRIFPNLLVREMNIDGPMQCVISDITDFYVKGVYYELTQYMNLWNNEILAHSLSAKRGDRMTYINGLKDLIELKKGTSGLATYPSFRSGFCVRIQEFQ